VIFVENPCDAPVPQPFRSKCLAIDI